MSDPLPSISYNQHDIIRWITALHLGGHRIELDPTYGRGSFYSPPDIKQPIFAHDNDPNRCTTKNPPIPHTEYVYVQQNDATDLPYESGTIRSIMFDPPFLQTTGKGSIMKDRFGSYPTMEDLWEFYTKAIWEFCRILKHDGVLVVKCQNTVMSGKQWWSRNYICNLSSHYGLMLVDEFVLLAKHRMKQHNMKKQRHARKYHCYFLVFRKGKQK